MMPRLWLLALIGGVSWGLWNPPAQAQTVEPSPALRPYRLELAAPTSPVRLRAEEARRLQKQRRRVVVAPAATASPRARARAGTRGVAGSTVTVQPPSVVNSSPQFRFRDLTERAAAVRPRRSMAQRQAAVEAYRQSLRRTSRLRPAPR